MKGKPIDPEQAARLAFEELMMPLISALRTELDLFGWQGYYAALKEVPGPILARAIDRALHSPLKFLPKATELLVLCEEARQEQSRALKWKPCEACETSPRWVKGEDGRLSRCPCWTAHLAKVAAGGLSTPLALPAAEEVEA